MIGQVGGLAIDRCPVVAADVGAAGALGANEYFAPDLPAGVLIADDATTELRFVVLESATVGGRVATETVDADTSRTSIHDGAMDPNRKETVSGRDYGEVITKPGRFVETIDGGDEACPVLGRLGQVEPVAQPAIAGAIRRRADSARGVLLGGYVRPSRGGTMVRFAARPLTSTRWPRQRRRIATAIAAGLTAVFLSACGVIAAFVPPLSVGDPLGVDGQIVSAALQDGAIQPQGTTHLDATRTFDVPDLEADLHGFSLAGFHTNAGLADEVRLSGPVGAEYPDRITVTRALIDAELWDDVNGSAAFTLDLTLALPFERTECTLDGCAYAYAGTDALADALDLEVTDSATLEEIVSILVLRETETPNQGAFRVAIEVDASTSLIGYVATFVLTSQGSTIRLGG